MDSRMRPRLRIRRGKPIAPEEIARGRGREGLSSSSAVRNERRDQRGPAGLVRSSEPLTRLAVEIFVEEDPVVPRGILVETTVPAIHGTMPISVAQEQS